MKALVVIHILIKDGCNHRTLGFLTGQNNYLNMSYFKDKSNPQGFASCNPKD